MNENLRERTDQATSTEDLNAEAIDLNKELLALEQRLADLKTANGGSLPELYQFNLSTLERTEREISDVRCASRNWTSARSSWPPSWPS